MHWTMVGLGNVRASAETNQETTVIIVNERALVGPNSGVQVRGGRLFLPVATIAQALGDTLSSDAASRLVTVRRQTGTTAVFNAPLNEVRENGAVVLTVSGTADLVFPPAANELMLPAEIVSALLDVTVRRDEKNAIVITRKGIKAETTIRSGAKQPRWELFQLEYDYNYTRYSEAGDHSLVIRGTGRVGDARLNFIANSAMGVTRNSSRPSLQGGTVRLDRPNGQSFVGGEFGTGTDVEFLSAAVRGGLVQLPLHRVRLDIFGGQTTSGIYERPLNSNPSSFSPLDVRYDTKVFGAIVTTATEPPRQRDFTLSAGAMHFGGSNRKGNMAAGGLKYISGLNRFQADLAMGQFSGINRDGTLTRGTSAAATFTGSYHLTDEVLLQGRYTHVGQAFLSPQSGIHTPTNAAAAGVSWQPRRWLTAGLSGSTATTPGKRGDFNRYVTASL
ncbi:MAG TPA: stalk domain-containing protein, partial [Pyrinomonadaceae bacterium]|nr:stalk domain-containing protein [Pyrinomonadaceae bacterium]